MPPYFNNKFTKKRYIIEAKRCVSPLLSAADVGELDVLELIVGVTHCANWVIWTNWTEARRPTSRSRLLLHCYCSTRHAPTELQTYIRLQSDDAGI